MIFGHQKNLKILSTLISENSFPHAVLFAGPQKIGKRKIAIEITKYLQKEHKENFFEFSKKNCECQICKLIENGNFADLVEINETEGQIPIQKIREIREKLSLTSIYPFKIVILNNVEKLSPEAAGALLKTLEEPKGDTIFFLLTSMPNLLPKTILSRITLFKFSLLPKDEIKKFLVYVGTKPLPSQEEKIIDLSLGKPGLAQELLIDKKKLIYYDSLLEKIESFYKTTVFDKIQLSEIIEKRGETEDFISLAEFWFRDLLLTKSGLKNISFGYKKNIIENITKSLSMEKIEESLKEISTTKRYLFFSNVSRILAFENLLLSI